MGTTAAMFWSPPPALPLILLHSLLASVDFPLPGHPAIASTYLALPPWVACICRNSSRTASASAPQALSAFLEWKQRTSRDEPRPRRRPVPLEASGGARATEGETEGVPLVEARQVVRVSRARNWAVLGPAAVNPSRGRGRDEGASRAGVGNRGVPSIRTPRGALRSIMASSVR